MKTEEAKNAADELLKHINIMGEKVSELKKNIDKLLKVLQETNKKYAEIEDNKNNITNKESNDSRY